MTTNEVTLNNDVVDTIEDIEEVDLTLRDTRRSVLITGTTIVCGYIFYKKIAKPVIKKVITNIKNKRKDLTDSKNDCVDEFETTEGLDD